MVQNDVNLEDIKIKFKDLIKSSPFPLEKFTNTILEIDPEIRNIDIISQVIRISYPNNEIVTIISMFDFENFIEIKLKKLSKRELEKIYFELAI